MKNTFRALRYLRGEGPVVAGVAGLILAGAAFGAVKPWPLSLLVDCVLGHRNAPAWLDNLAHPSRPVDLVPWLVGLIFLFHLGQGAISSLYTYLSIAVGLRGLARVRQELFEKLMRLSLRFHQSARIGDVIYRATWDTYSFQTYFQQGWITFLTAFSSLAIMVAVMARLNHFLTLIALGTVPFLLLAIRLLGPAMSERSRRAQQADSRVSSTVQQDLTALPVIQSYTREEREIEKFRKQIDEARGRRLSQHGFEVLYGLGVTLVFAAGASAIAWAGAGQVMTGKLTLGQLLVFLAYLAQFYEPLNQLSHVGATLSGAGAGMARVFEVLDSPEVISSTGSVPVPAHTDGSRDTAAPGPSGTGEIRFEKVSFGYEASKSALREVDLSIPDRRVTAVIGPSGAGKSTLLSLLPRFFDPASGRITLNGTDLREYDLRELRRRIALVLQEPVLLPASISENIAFGRPDASATEIEAAAQAAQADEFIRQLPAGYDTMVGDGAIRLSVGEKQRLSLARAFLKNAPILLLDEPTSALDRESEAQVAQSIQQLMRGRTTLMVAHRLRTIESADRIIVMNQGAVQETGTMAELRASGGYLARMLDI